jgi:hypothetical protein
MLVAEPGRTVPPELVTDMARELGRATGADAIRVSTSSATSWQERQAIDEWGRS